MIHIHCCPFCGSDRVNVCRTNKDACWIECANTSCGAATSSRKTKVGAIGVWNKRTSTWLATAEIDEDDDEEFRKRKKA